MLRVPFKSQIDGEYMEISYKESTVESYVSELLDYLSRLCKQNIRGYDEQISKINRDMMTRIKT